jgi:hypothetical protein
MCMCLQFDYLGETTEGNLHLVQRLKRDGMVNVFGLNSLEDIVTVPVADLAAATQVGRHLSGQRSCAVCNSNARVVGGAGGQHRCYRAQHQVCRHADAGHRLHAL